MAYRTELHHTLREAKSLLMRISPQRMEKGIRVAQLLGIPFVLIAAVVQWAVLLERTLAVVWEWYKFHGYGGSQITVGKNTQVLFYLLSSLTALIGLIFSRQAGDAGASELIRRKVSRISVLAIVIGMLFWTVILLSPLVTFR